MADLIRADPEVLDAYTMASRTPRILASFAIGRYRRAWDALLTAPADPPLAVLPSRADDLSALMEEVRALDDLPAVMATALRELDRNGDGAINAADGLVLADHPELLVLLFPDGAQTAGDPMLQALLDDFDVLVDLVGHPDGSVILWDLEDLVDDPRLPLHLQASIRWMMDNPTVVEVMMWEADSMLHLHPGDIELFLETNEHLRNLVGFADDLDTAAKGGDPDGYVSHEDLVAAASDTSLPPRVRAAAQHLLDHPRLLGSIGSPPSPDTAAGWADFGDGLIARLVNGQAFAHDPAAAAGFVRTLEVPQFGEMGLPIWATSDDGFAALANAALRHVDGSLTGTQEIIARLPETASGRRNELITSFYDLVASRGDAVFAEAAGATPGDPTSSGHPGANWLHFAPWASDGVNDVISGDFRALGVFGPTRGASQAAADGNQWIFDDITSRFAAFVELQETTGGQPTTEQLQRFFDDNFTDGDLQIRQGFQAYVAAMATDDPAARQVLMFQGNTLVAIHEQAGAHPWLGMLSGIVPDHIATSFIDVQMGDHTIHVDRDIPEVAAEHNLVVPEPILDLDPALLDPDDLAVPGVDLVDMTGWEDDFVVSTTDWYENVGGIPIHTYPPTGQQFHVDPDDSLAGTGAVSWPDYEQRMWSIHRLFEQLHSDPSLHQTDAVRAELDLDWLDDDLRSGVSR